MKPKTNNRTKFQLGNFDQLRMDIIILMIVLLKQRTKATKKQQQNLKIKCLEMNEEVFMV